MEQYSDLNSDMVVLMSACYISEKRQKYSASFTGLIVCRLQAQTALTQLVILCKLCAGWQIGIYCVLWFMSWTSQKWIFVLASSAYFKHSYTLTWDDSTAVNITLQAIKYVITGHRADISHFYLVIKACMCRICSTVTPTIDSLLLSESTRSFTWI